MSLEAFISLGQEFVLGCQFIRWPGPVRQLKAHVARKCLRLSMERPFSLEACKSRIRAVTVGYSLAALCYYSLVPSLVFFH